MTKSNPPQGIGVPITKGVAVVTGTHERMEALVATAVL
jgi:hypothetical protein